MKLFLGLFLSTFLLIGCSDLEIMTDIQGDNEGTEEELKTTEEVLSSTDTEGKLIVHFIDVGQGDAILLETDNYAAMIDTVDYRGDEVVPYLIEHGIDALDLAIITHPHADHIGQLDTLMYNIDVEEVWMNGHQHDTQTFERVIDAILDTDAYYDEPRAGDTYELGDALITVLHPTVLSGDLNNDSIVLKVEFGEVSFLFAGDAESDAEFEMVNSGYDLSADIVKVGHHGSDTSSSASFLDQVNPDVAVYMAGIDNSYGHPHASALSRIESVGSDIYGTDIHGHVIVTTDGLTYEIHTIEDSAPTSASEAAPDPEIEEVVSTSDEDVEDVFETAASCEAWQVAINSASVLDLQRIHQIAEERAILIAEQRARSNFSSYSHLTRVKGIGNVLSQEIEAQGIICFD